MYGIPHTLGAVDGTHISIHKPPINHPTALAVFSITEKICDAKSRITSVNPNFPGSTHDAAIWQSSNVHQYLKDQYVDHRPMEWLLGDKGYPLLPWLMTPLAEVGAGTRKKGSKTSLFQNVPYPECHFPKMSLSHNVPLPIFVCKAAHLDHEGMMPGRHHTSRDQDVRFADKYCERDMMGKGHFGKGTFWERDILGKGHSGKATFWEKDILGKGDSGTKGFSPWAWDL
ncbi:DDE superfamily endonuclease domain-containing protein [Phthorimaea operculella]|nr:DDE superfamily endonuclease domain-containing protein [Phthorimaea operculella]